MSLLLASKQSAFPLTKVSAFEGPAILKKFVLKEVTLEAAKGLPRLAKSLVHPLLYLQCYHFGVWNMWSSKKYNSRTATTQITK